MSDLETAIQIATRAHAGQYDKAGKPYILHPLRLMLRCDDPISRVVAALHDVVEDTKISIDDLKRAGFSTDVIDAVYCLTKRQDESYDDYISRILQNPVARRVKELDLLDNLDCTRLGELTDSDLNRLKKYSIALCRIRAETTAKSGSSYAP